MAKTTKIILIAALSAVIALTVLSSVFAYLAFTGDFDHDLFYFERGSVTAALATVLPFVGVIIAFVPAFFLRKKASFTGAPAANPPTVFASVISGIFIIASAFIPGGVTGSLATVKPVIFIAISLIAGVYFILLPFLRPGTDSPRASLMTGLSFAPSLFFAVMLLEEYFRPGEPLNSPIRTVNLTAYVLLLLFFAEDIRFGIDKAKPTIYYVSALSALSFTGVASIPKLVLILTGAEGFSFNFMEWCVAISAFMFILARLSALPSVLGEYKPDNSKKNEKVTSSAKSSEGSED